MDRLKSVPPIIPILLLWPMLNHFVLLSGPREATLDASPSSPVIEFALDDTVPDIEGKAEFKGGIFANLSDEAFWRILVQEAMKPWNEVADSYLVLQISDDAAASSNENDEIHSITVDSVNLSSAAFASPNIDDDTIVDCDITVGDRGTSAESLAYTMMHEIGHCIGLGHNHTNYDAVMGYSRNNRQLRLGLDDKSGLVYLYPNASIDDPVETFGCGVVGSAQSSFVLWILLMIPLVSFIRL